MLRVIRNLLIRNSSIMKHFTRKISLFLFVLMLNELSKGRKNSQLKHFVFAGISITIAAGFRYESWLIMAIFGLLLLVYKLPKQAIVFSVFALIFPIIWMYSNWLATDDPLFGIKGNYNWTHKTMGVNEELHLKEIIKRIGYFPYSWVLLIGFPTAFLIVKYGFKIIKEKQKEKLFWLIPFLLLFGFMIYNSAKGNLLNQHRFTGTLVVMSLPFFALFFEEFLPKYHNGFTKDYWDYLAYALGSILFYYSNRKEEIV